MVWTMTDGHLFNRVELIEHGFDVSHFSVILIMNE